MKKFLSVLLCSLLVVTLFSGCGSKPDDKKGPTETDKEGEANKEQEGETVPEEEKKLVIYSPNTEDMVNAIIPAFEKETGIKVELISAGQGELWKRIEQEKENPYCDVLWGGMYTVYTQHLDLLDDYVSVHDAELPEAFRNKKGKISFYCLDGSNLLVNTDLIGDVEIKGYADLLKPELAGKIIMGDPTSSGSAFAQLTNMLLAMGGDYTSQAGWDYVEALLTQIGGKVAGSSSAVHKGVADGEYTVGLTYEDPSASYVRDGAPVKIVYMKEGVVFLAASTSVIAKCKHPGNARKFIDFVTSQETQDIYGTVLTARPVSDKAKLGDYWTPMSDIKLIIEDEEYVQGHRDEILEHYTEIFTRIAG